MKHFMQPRNTILIETHSSESPSSSSPNPNSKLKSSQKQKSSKENAPLSDLNSLLPPSLASSKIKSPLPPCPPNPLKRKLATDTFPENVMVGVHNSVQLRPVNKEEEQGEMIVQKVGNDALKINGQTFTFDSVADIDLTQLDVFQLVGLALIENCLAGFNSSVFAYRQGVERLIPCGDQLTPCWKKTYQVINKA
ncbi:kinesin-like protein KIN-12B isoform X2 [Pistacia vera]|uniref:kinesin-like protein KIN-12B isoform X2 n=1 Tax=Pistacia vera TaxID=55513 RepID=UPI0012635B8D|nr:kinesin-like protein KIN-12B isoform X2 [Pistacia vera]